MAELQVSVEEAKRADESLDVLLHPQSLGEQCGEMAGKRKQAFGAQMGLGLLGWVDVSRAASVDV